MQCLKETFNWFNKIGILLKGLNNELNIYYIIFYVLDDLVHDK